MTYTSLEEDHMAELKDEYEVGVEVEALKHAHAATEGLRNENARLKIAWEEAETGRMDAQREVAQLHAMVGEGLEKNLRAYIKLVKLERVLLDVQEISLRAEIASMSEELSMRRAGAEDMRDAHLDLLDDCGKLRAEVERLRAIKAQVLSALEAASNALWDIGGAVSNQVARLCEAAIRAAEEVE